MDAAAERRVYGEQRVFLLAADFKHVHTCKHVYASIFALIGCSLLIPFRLLYGNLKLLYSIPLGVTCPTPAGAKHRVLPLAVLRMLIGAVEAASRPGERLAVGYNNTLRLKEHTS